MFDIDHFKSINDHYGHDAGDIVLKTIAQLIRHNIRERDIFARLGGEEFMILLDNASLDKALKLAEKLRQIIKDHHFDGPGQVTISLGVTHIKPADGIIQLLKRTDDALYEAKQSSRDQTIAV